MILTRNKIAGVLLLWLMGIILNLLSFGSSLAMSNSHIHQESRHEYTETGLTREMVVAVTPTARMYTFTFNRCYVGINDEYLPQGSISAFLMVPQDCVSLSIGSVTTQSRLVVVDKPSAYSVAVHTAFQPTISIPVSLRNAPAAEPEAMLPPLQTTPDKMGFIASLAVVLATGSLAVAFRRHTNNVQLIYLQIFRC